MRLERNLADLQRHATHFVERRGFTYTVLEIVGGDVIGCVYIYPSASDEYDAEVSSWVRADRTELDGPVYSAVAD
ncbi:hypothetical protein IU433_04805 [Nocardia puris]|uniref:Uncharacterized protein n=1 Tax=Nocardia puris TaxID=208602 RepID=A0A366E0Z8_9NOCA|nr:hypothetical protein [Nocardia puris]MBF6209726.1 hypothetical protein [Nocardia puris]MBF6366298.1 hypothetical protein [Nocardia puris]MBF6458363.1 hypothetical protein [Nocardia puris]RBO96012.1 hypothetical protein DFR74_10123 [Nocardia puris]